MKKADMVTAAEKLNIDISDLLEPYEGRRGRLPESLIEAVKERLHITDDAPKVPSLTERITKGINKLDDSEEDDAPRVDPAPIVRKVAKPSGFTPGQKLDQVSYGLGKEARVPVTFLGDQEDGKVKIQRQQFVAIVHPATLKLRHED